MKNSLAVITGASSGLGFEMAFRFGQNGHDLLIVSPQDDIFEAQRILEEEGFTVDAIKVNVGSFKGIENLYQQILKTEKIVDIISVNAGISHPTPSKNSLKEDIIFINYNLLSTVHLLNLLLPDMKERNHGKILLTYSSTGQGPESSDPIFKASRSFLFSFAESLRKELAGTAIVVKTLDSEQTDDPKEAAAAAFEALMEGKEIAVDGGFLSKIQHYAQKMIPNLRPHSDH